MADGSASKSLTFLFDSIEENAKADPSPVLVPPPEELRGMEVARLFAEAQEPALDNPKFFYDPSVLTTNFSAIHLGYESVRKNERAPKPLWQQPDSHLLSEPGEASYYELKERLAYLTRRVPKGKEGLQTDFTWAVWKRMLKAFHWRCAYCESGSDLEQDHVVPIQRGGEDLMTNILPACHTCNCQKDLLSLESWFKAKGKKFRERAVLLIDAGRNKFFKNRG